MKEEGESVLAQIKRGNSKLSRDPEPQMLILVDIEDQEGLEKVVERYMHRNEIESYGLQKEDVERAIVEHARKTLGLNKEVSCVNCIYSGPARGRMSWIARTCVLGFDEETCKMFKPIVKEKKSN